MVSGKAPHLSNSKPLSRDTNTAGICTESASSFEDDLPIGTSAPLGRSSNTTTAIAPEACA